MTAAGRQVQNCVWEAADFSYNIVNNTRVTGVDGTHVGQEILA